MGKESKRNRGNIPILISGQSYKDHNPQVKNNKNLEREPVVLKRLLFDSRFPSFSFKYFRQYDFFGLDNVNSSWFVSLLDRLRDVSMLNMDEFLNDENSMDECRYHDINWNSKNIPVQKDSFYWIDKPILDNDEEYPFLQFHVSKSLGRIIGFRNPEQNIFYVIVLDRWHNMQPSKDFGYRVTRTNILRNEYSSLLFDLKNLHECGKNVECPLLKQIIELPKKHIEERQLWLFLDNSFGSELNNLLKEKSLQEIIEAGITYLC